MGAGHGEIITETLQPFGRAISVAVPVAPIDAVVYTGDGQHVVPWAADLIDTDRAGTLVVGVHGVDDEDERLHEYSPGFDPGRFAAHERFLVDDVRAWVADRFAAPPAARTAVYGASAAGELALALGLRHPDVFGAVLCASPGAGFRPPEPMPRDMPPTYLVAGTDEPFFWGNAIRWAVALGEAKIESLMTEREGGHGDHFWRDEFPLMLSWAFDR
ncbi:MAG: alpha/beta hydrolase-fold protein [Actinomycetota bacterium]